METSTIQIQGISAQTLQSMFDRLEAKIQGIADGKQPKTAEQYLTRMEVADLFKISLPTVHAWANKGLIQPYKVANKTRFKLSEVEQAFTKMNAAAK
ncbi:MAG: helix-turn-helix domain-containing protein [Bacteroidota bacterium]